MNKIDIIKFLECYEQHPCLWDPRNKLYRNHSFRTAALNAMISELQLHLSISELKTKIKSVRIMYSREAAKIASSKKSGAGTDDVYIPKVSWFQVAERFLKPVGEGRATETNMVESRESEAGFFDDHPSGSQVRRPKKVTPVKSKSQDMEPILQAVNKLENISHSKMPDEFEVFGSHIANQSTNILSYYFLHKA
ncbi:PREDICTED: uncharacterized protein LOC108366408 [Rhagoletis zephyria]|uniref:uncharacterized protein LOC108366408 n=1 Tax=Rhagoletis zephyria TaxID=28612 RepID=UPI0008113928|nr:PREDICTED: uncharacterized protein LOC108366408 [Rhagoletis zephyria]